MTKDKRGFMRIESYLHSTLNTKLSIPFYYCAVVAPLDIFADAPRIPYRNIWFLCKTNLGRYRPA
ncbi:MAG: hypothetical protein LBH92_01200 [Bacteroidales bacterium]|nr:hypothetical protein [Bacteroidales bacterium]